MVNDTRSDDIQSYSECRANFADALQRASDTGQPTFITNHGRAAGVLLSPAAYDSLIEKAELVDEIAALQRALANSKAGKGRDAKTALREIADKLAVTIER